MLRIVMIGYCRAVINSTGKKERRYVWKCFFMKREIPYSKIRGVEKARRFYSDSMLSLKSSLDHLNIKYNTFDIMSISVVESDGFVRELSERCQRAL